MRDPSDPELYHEMIGGLTICSQPHLTPKRSRKRARHARQRLLRQPDYDDHWEWCQLCETWHRHKTCV